MKLTVEFRVLIDNKIGFLRTIIKNANNEIVFDRTGQTAPLENEVLEKIPSEDALVKMVEAEFSKGAMDIDFVKVKDNLKK